VRLYLDANAIIYACEGTDEVKRAVVEWVVQACVSPGGAVFTSRLSRLECRVLPLRMKDQRRLALYETLFDRLDLQLFDVTADVLDLATTLRAEYGFKTADAIHLATARLARADLLLTGDMQLTRYPDIAIELVRPS
jgi:predicted nucleic acid-binding protein